MRDGGIRGVVISAARILRSIERVEPYLVTAESGVPCTQLARHCLRWGIGPAEFFAGIPGTVGGALAMNAGAHGGETWERVESVRTINRNGEIHERAPGEYSVGYRSVTGHQTNGSSKARFALIRSDCEQRKAGRLAGTTQDDTTTRPAELWFSVPQSCG